MYPDSPLGTDGEGRPELASGRADGEPLAASCRNLISCGLSLSSCVITGTSAVCSASSWLWRNCQRKRERGGGGGEARKRSNKREVN